MIFAGLQIAIGDLFDLVALLGRNHHLDGRARIGRGACQFDFSLGRIVGRGGRDAVAWHFHQAFEQLAGDGFRQPGFFSDRSQQLQGDGLHRIHRAGPAFTFTAVPTFGRGRKGRCFHICLGDGADDHVTVGFDIGILCVVLTVEDLCSNILYDHIDGKEAAGFILALSALGIGFNGQITLGGQYDIALVCGQLCAVHNGVDVGHHSGNCQRKRQVAGAGAGLDLNGTLGFSGNGAGRLQFRTVVQPDLGGQYIHCHRQG